MTKIMLICIAVIISYGSIKKQNCFDLFIDGVKEGIKLLIPMFCSLMALMFFINLLTTTKLIETLTHLPILSNFSSEILSMMFLRPFSSSGSLLLLEKLYQTYGLNHFYSMVGTLIQSSTDTTLYIASLYLGGLNIKNENKAIYLGLFLDALSIFLAFIFTIIYFLL
ncbi:MAG: hypothetical protein KHY88_03815 [Erysipelotrichaceae bacterium]|nr:hypothetical protein [Erysipelotrichaceae bacterium]